jgi:hypothetical protein
VAPDRERAPLDRLHAGAGNAAVAALLRPALESPGRPLDSPLRAEMELRLGHDLGGVRIHDGAAAAGTSAALGADALTFGRDVVFGAGRFRPDASSGRTLLAHELAHVVQQRMLTSPVPAIADEGSSFERAAQTPGASLAPLPSGAPAVQRQVAGETKQEAPQKPKVTNEDRDQMKADVEAIVAELRSSFFTDEWKIVRLALKWDERDRLHRESTGYQGSDYLDRFLLDLKLRAYSRRTAGAAWVEQWGIVYDDVWHELGGQRLRTWKEVVARSRKQATDGPSGDTHENFWAKLSKQEAIGVWGILKGMGTAAAGTVDAGAWAVTRALQDIGIPAAEPESAAAWLAQQYDLSGEAMFGRQDWSHGDKLVLGMSASDIGTTGGGIIWQLVMLKAPGGAPKWARQALLYLGIAGSLRGVETSAKALASIVEQMQTAGQPITAGALLSNPQFRSEAVKLAVNAVAAMSAGSGSNSQITQATSEAWRRAGIYMDLTSAAVDLGNLTEIAASDKPQAEKEKAAGEILANLISTGISIGQATTQHEQRMSDVAEAQQKQQPGQKQQRQQRQQQRQQEQQKQQAPPPESTKLEPPKPEQKLLTAGEQKSEQKPLVTTEPKAEAQTPEAQPKPEPTVEAQPKPEPPGQPKPEPLPKPEPQAKQEPEAKPDPQPKQPEPAAEAPAPKPETHPDPEPKPLAAEAKAEPKVVAGEAGTEPKPLPKAPPQQSPLEFGRSGVEMPWVGNAGKDKQSALGYLRDHERFWAEYSKKFPEHLSEANRKLIAEGRSPEVDPKWIEFHPMDAPYSKQVLEHHHVGEGSFTVPLPHKLHKAHSVTHPQWRPVGTPKKGFDPKRLGPLVPREKVQSEVARHTGRGKMTKDPQGKPYQLGDVSPKTALWAVEPEARGKISGDLGVDPTTGVVTKKGEQAPTGRADTEKRYAPKKLDKPPTVVDKPPALKPADPKADPHFTDVMAKPGAGEFPMIPELPATAPAQKPSKATTTKPATTKPVKKPPKATTKKPPKSPTKKKPGSS